MSRTNPCTIEGRDPKTGKLTVGNRAASNKSKNKMTRELFTMMDDGQYTLEAGSYLVGLMQNDEAPAKERRAAAEFIVKHFSVSADKLTDADLVEKASLSKAEMIESILNQNTINKEEE